MDGVLGSNMDCKIKVGDQVKLSKEVINSGLGELVFVTDVKKIGAFTGDIKYLIKTDSLDKWLDQEQVERVATGKEAKKLRARSINDNKKPQIGIRDSFIGIFLVIVFFTNLFTVFPLALVAVIGIVYLGKKYNEDSLVEEYERKEKKALPILVFVIVVIGIYMMIEGNNNPENYKSEPESTSYHDILYSGDGTIASDGYISSHVGKKRANIMRDLIIAYGYSCPKVFTANQLITKSGFSITCKTQYGSHYDYEVVDRGGTWTVILK